MTTSIELFWAKVKITPGCWVWTGARDRGGYGAVKIRGRRWSAHRAVFHLAEKPIPEDMTVDHICRNRACVNPSHLRFLSMRDNTLSGLTIPAINAAKTRCTHGHEFDEKNTYIDPSRGWRVCRKCKAHRMAEKRRRVNNVRP